VVEFCDNGDECQLVCWVIGLLLHAITECE